MYISYLNYMYMYVLYMIIVVKLTYYGTGVHTCTCTCNSLTYIHCIYMSVHGTQMYMVLQFLHCTDVHQYSLLGEAELAAQLFKKERRRKGEMIRLRMMMEELYPH